MSARSSPVRQGFVAPPAARGFSLIEVLIALSILLVGGVSVMSVFALAADFLVERKIEEKLILVRPEAVTMAQDAVDTAAPGAPPRPIGDAKDTSSWRPSAQPGFAISIVFAPSPYGAQDPWSYAAQIRVAYRGSELPRSSYLAFVTKSTLDPTQTTPTPPKK